MKKKEKKRNGIPARTRRWILAACMVFFLVCRFFKERCYGENPQEKVRVRSYLGKCLRKKMNGHR